MASLIRPLRRTLLLTCSRTLIPQFQSQLHNHETPISLVPRTARRRISEMRQFAIESRLARLLRSEIQYELDHSPPRQFIAQYDGFTVDNRSGEQWISLKRKFGDREEIKVEVTMFHVAALPKAVDEEVKLELTLIVNIAKGENVLEIMCAAGPDSMEIKKLFTRGNDLDSVPAKPYIGPDFKELDDELQESLYVFLEARGIDDYLAAFLHEYMKNKAKTEFIRWMGTVESIIEKK